MNEQKELSFLGHLRDLRSCLLRIIIVIGVALIASFFLSEYVIEFLKQPVPHITLIYTELTEMIGIFFKVSLILAVIIALPFITYQTVTFIKPALTKRERWYLYVMLPSVLICFAAGVAFAYFVLIPPAFTFLLTFGGDIAQPMIKIDNYISVLTNLLFWIGLCFELPLVIFFLAKIGVVTPQWLSKNRKLFYILAFVLGAMITPTFDPVNQSLVALPIIVLYEAGILLARAAVRHKQVPDNNVPVIR